ncbi:MAG: winged helix-turn-helix domain-containing protein [Thermoplasmata archaeon]|nr:winged helix-turn-helix domain-containing protein [Thermoplasmata archaeon]
MNPAFRSLMWYLLVGTRGGPNRQRILAELHRSPANAHRLASALALDYRTVRHHLKLLEENGVVARTVPGVYAPPYELSAYLAEHYELVLETIVVPAARPGRRAPALGAMARRPQGAM